MDTVWAWGPARSIPWISALHGPSLVLRLLFPVPKGPWPRHGHANALLQEYQRRTPRLVAWARAAFEQGALPSLLLLPGLVPIFTLPGDKMYQSIGICIGKQRPPIIHAYGGAKRDMASALATIAVEGWIPLAAAMVGTHDKPPMWAGTGLQPVIGITIDLKVAPAPLSDRNLRLLLSCWKRWDAKVVSGSALATWLCNVQSEFGPECKDSPQFRRVDIDMLEAARLLNESGFQFLPEKELQDVTEMEIIMSVGLRLCALEFTSAQLQTLSYFSVTGLLPALITSGSKQSNGLLLHRRSRLFITYRSGRRLVLC